MHALRPVRQAPSLSWMQPPCTFWVRFIVIIVRYLHRIMVLVTVPERRAIWTGRLDHTYGEFTPTIVRSDNDPITNTKHEHQYFVLAASNLRIDRSTNTSEHPDFANSKAISNPIPSDIGPVAGMEIVYERERERESERASARGGQRRPRQAAAEAEAAAEAMSHLHHQL
jgi:hypothetical protein